MTKKITRRINGQPEIVVVSDRKADAMLAKGWKLFKEPKEPKPYEGKKRGPKPKVTEDE